MTDRSSLFLGTIIVLAVLAIFLNLDLFVPGYEHSTGVLRFLPWQGENLNDRSVKLREGLDLQGGLQALLEGDIRGAEPGDLQQAAAIIRNRVDALGVNEPLIQTQGDDKIVVELPGVSDPDQAVRTIGKTALLEFVYSGSSVLSPGDVVSTTWGVSRTLFAELPEAQQKPFLATVGVGGAVTTTNGTEAASPTEPASPTEVTTPITGTESLTTTSGLTGTAGITATTAAEAAPTATVTSTVTGTGTRTVTLYPTVLTGEALQNAQVGRHSVTGQVIVNFQLNAEGGRRMGRFTGDHLSDDQTGKIEVMPIVLDGEVISSPRVNGQIQDQGMIEGQFRQADAESLVAQLNSGALPIRLNLVGQTLIGPTLGRQSVDLAVRGGIIGMLVVMLFMLLIYRLPGALADIALLLYALFSLALFRLIPVTLTLAGIAGFVLSLGMAVDANILIFERMKEELRGGRRLGAAMEVGFTRAWPSIRDSNISTLITCAILFWFGNQFGASIVKGFAVTLSLGVLTSMFTAIVVTRSLLKLTSRYLLHDDPAVPTASNPRLRALLGF